MASRKVTFLITAQTKAFNKALNKAQYKLKAFGRKTERLGRSLTAGFTLPLAAAAGVALKSAADYEKLRVQLDTLTGSVEKGAQVFKNLKQYSAKTPFQLKDLARANNTLLGFGENTQDAFKHLKMLGDVAAVTGGDLQAITVAFGQGSAEGKLMTRDIRQLINQGVPAIKLLSDSMGVAKDQILDMASQGKITFPVLVKALEKATGAGGMFEGGTKKLSKTLYGLYSTIKDNLSIAFAELGEAIAKSFDIKKLADQFIKKIKEVTKWFASLSDEQKNNIFWWAKWIAIIGPSVLIAGKFITAISSIIGVASSLVGVIPGLIAGFEGLNVVALIASEEGLAAAITSLTAFEGLLALTGIGAIIAGLTALGVHAYKSYQQTQKLHDVLENLDKVSLKQINKSIAELQKKVNRNAGFGLADKIGQWLGLTDDFEKQLDTLIAKKRELIGGPDILPGVTKTGTQQVTDMGFGLDNLINPKAPSLIVRPTVDIEPTVSGSSGGGISKIQKKIKEVIGGVQKQLDAFANQARFPDIFPDTATQRLSAIKSAMKKLIKAGISPASKAFQNLKGIYDSFKTSISSKDVTTVGVSTVIDTAGLDTMISKTKDLRTATEIALGKTHQAYSDFSKKLSSEVVPVIVDGLFNIGTAFLENAVAALTAGSAFKDAGLQLLKGLADLAIKAGSIILAAGIGIESLRDSLISFTGIGAIVAGGALIAIGAAAKGALKAAGSSPATGVSSSGGSLSGTTSPSLSNTDSTRVFLSNISNNSQSAFQSAMERALSNARWKVSGGDLRMVLNNSSNSYR